jgi:hypothetical protein
MAAFLAGAALSALLTGAIEGRGNADHVAVPAAGTDTTTGTTAASPVPVTPPMKIGSPQISAPTTVAANTGGVAPITGRVNDSQGHPVPEAYVIGLQSLTVVRTDSAGRFSMPCMVAEGATTARRTEPLVASTWLLPVIPTGQGSISVGRNSTAYGTAPTAPGLGYAFSGGAADSAHAKVVTCDGQPADFVLPPGGGADIQFLDAAGSPVTSFPGPPVDNLYLPGLGDHGMFETAPLSSDGHQVIQQLGPGILNLDVLYPMACSEAAGPQPGPLNGWDVTITAGQTARILCRETTSGPSAGSPTSPTST